MGINQIGVKCAWQKEWLHEVSLALDFASFAENANEGDYIGDKRYIIARPIRKYFFKEKLSAKAEALKKVFFP